MSSERKIEANRANAQLSTGPRTPEGKAAVALNRLQHGLYATTIVLPSEDPAEYERLHDEYKDFYQPQNVTERDLVEHLSATKWRLRRAAKIEADFELLQDAQDIDWRLANFNRVTQCQGRLYRLWDKLRKDLDALVRARPAAVPAPPPAPAKPVDKDVDKDVAKAVDKDDDNDKWATAEEWEAQIKTKPLPRNFKPPKKFQLNSYLGPNGEKVCVARIYKGKSVDKFPDEE